MYSGLIGPLKVCRKGALQADGIRKDVKREFALLFLVFDENMSWYLEENVQRYSSGSHKDIDLLDEKFVESNKMHGNAGRALRHPAVAICAGLLITLTAISSQKSPENKSLTSGDFPHPFPSTVAQTKLNSRLNSRLFSVM